MNTPTSRTTKLRIALDLLLITVLGCAAAGAQYGVGDHFAGHRMPQYSAELRRAKQELGLDKLERRVAALEQCECRPTPDAPTP